MKLNIEVDQSRILDEARKDTELGMTVNFEHAGIFYPGSTWNDFGVRLLGFWLQQLLYIHQDGQHNVKFVFLDGDFELCGEIDSNQTIKLTPKNADENFTWSVPLSEFENAIIKASHKFLDDINRLGIRPSGIEGVEKGIQLIKEITG